MVKKLCGWVIGFENNDTTKPILCENESMGCWCLTCGMDLGKGE